MKSLIFKSILVTALAGLTLPVTPVSGQNLTGLGSPQLDTFIEQKMAQFRTPGLAVIVVKDEEVLWSNGYGHADLPQRTPVTADTVFHVGSISKTVVATAVMQLWERGEFDLDDDVNGHLLFPVRSPHFPDVPITFRMLLQHDSGLTVFGALANLPFISLGQDSPNSLHDYLASHLVPGGAHYHPSIFNTAHPGTVFDYSNVGYALLGYLVERVSGVPFHQYCAENIFAPLGMTRTTFRLADLAAWNIEAAVPYVWSHTTQSYYVLFGHHSFPNYVAAGVRSSVNDLARLLLAYKNGGTHGGATILQPETLALMHTPAYAGMVGGGWTWGYGLGFEIDARGPQQEQPRIGHNGQSLGTRTGLYFRPEQGIGVIVLANAPGPILTPAAVQDIPARDFAVLQSIPERLMDEAAAQP